MFPEGFLKLFNDSIPTTRRDSGIDVEKAISILNTPSVENPGGKANKKVSSLPQGRCVNSNPLNTPASLPNPCSSFLVA